MSAIKKLNRVGSIGTNTYGSKMIVDEYIETKKIWVRFIETNNRVFTSWQRFCTGNVKNIYDKSVYGVGYIGEGDYKVSINDKKTPQYSVWKGAMERCYGEKFSLTNKAYKGCFVIEEWHNFQNFAKWYDENYYEIEGEKIHLDKDILVKGNKIYSPDTCVFVPQRINSLFIRNTLTRGNQPIGVTLKDNKYRASISNFKSGHVHVGNYNTPEEAFQSYKVNKEKQIKQIAEEYKDKIPAKLYDTMINYIVEITD